MHRTALLRCWNWKAAVLSSIFRAVLFVAANLSAGPKGALAAGFTELVFRFIASGFYGSLTQVLGRVEPAWTGAILAATALPLLSHSTEFLVHTLRGTPKLRTSMIVSISFTAISTAFHWFAMREGALIVGEGGESLGSDLARMPGLLLRFLGLQNRDRPKCSEASHL